jgi:acetyltransferase-like isoleucine patch superfamily enzyme
MNKNLIDVFYYIKSIYIFLLIHVLYIGQVKTKGFQLITNFPIIRGRNGSVIIGPNSRINGTVKIFFDDKNTKGLLVIGSNFVVNGNVTISPRGGKIFIDNNCFIGDAVFIQSFTGGTIKLDENVMVASNTSILGSNHVIARLDIPINRQSEIAGSIRIREDVWIGANVCVLAGVEIGKGSVVAAGAVVSRNLPPYVVAAGVPAKIISQRK